MSSLRLSDIDMTRNEERPATTTGKQAENKRIGVVSWSNQLRTYSSLNHAIYCRRHGYTYLYDTAPILDPFNIYYGKIIKVLKFLEMFDWVFWIDDDAFFTNPGVSLEQLLEEADPGDADLVICSSPINQGQFTYVSSGQFFLRNTGTARDFLEAVLAVPRDELSRNWDKEKYGIYTQGDQDAIIHLLDRDARFSEKFAQIVDYSVFNCRPFHYSERLDEHFLVHFTGHDKGALVRDFAVKIGCNLALIDDSLVPEMYRSVVLTQGE